MRFNQSIYLRSVSIY